MSSRAETVFAIIGGSLLGTIGALMTGGAPSAAPPPDGREPFRPLASVTAPAATSARLAVAAAPSRASAAPPPAPQSAPEHVWERTPFTLSPAAREQAELACSRGSADPCMHAGLSYLEGTGAERNETRAKLLLGRARKLYVVACQNREAGACLALSQIYTDGIGTVPNPENAKALAERARELCAAKSTPVCADL